MSVKFIISVIYGQVCVVPSVESLTFSPDSLSAHAILFRIACAVSPANALSAVDMLSRSRLSSAPDAIAGELIINAAKAAAVINN